MKILFFGTSNVALPVLERLVRHHEIVAVVTTPDTIVGRKHELTESPVAVLAGEMELKILRPESLSNDQELIEALRAMSPDVSVVVSYGKLIPKEVLDIPKLKTLNIHFSVLPKYRGAAPLQYAIKNGDLETGVTIFQLDENLDTGPIIKSQAYKIEPDDNFISLAQRLAYSSADLIMEVLPQYQSGKLTPLPQDDSQATYTKTTSKQDGKIDWNKTASEIYNQFRAFYPWPGIWTSWNGVNLKIIDCSVCPLPDPPPNHPIPASSTWAQSGERSRTRKQKNGDPDSGEGVGTVLPGAIVLCGSHTKLQIKTLQLAGKKETDIESFLRGYKDFVGSNLK